MNKLTKIIIYSLLTTTSCTIGALDKNERGVKENKLEIKTFPKGKPIPSEDPEIEDKPIFRKYENTNPAYPDLDREIYMV